MNEIIIAILGGSAAAALVNQAGEYLRIRRKRKEDAESTESGDIKSLKTAVRWIMLDRIRWLGQGYIKQGAIAFDDRRLLNEMHRSYHDGLGGNGDLDRLMVAVNALPLIIDGEVAG